MKKTWIVIGSIVIVLAIILSLGLYMVQTPEYALLTIARDVKTSGIDGLRPHLTDDALAVVDKVSAITENKLIGAIVSLLGKNESVSILKSKMQEMQWNVVEIMKGKEHADVILAFDYDDKMTGTIEMSMVHSKDGWKIDGLELPKIETFNW